MHVPKLCPIRAPNMRDMHNMRTCGCFLQHKDLYVSPDWAWTYDLGFNHAHNPEVVGSNPTPAIR